MAFTGEIFEIMNDGMMSINKHNKRVPKFNANIYPKSKKTGASVT